MKMILNKKVWGLTIATFILEVLLFIGLSFSSMSCTKRLEPSAIEGRWYTQGRASYIEFNGGNLSGVMNSTTFNGTYRISKKDISFSFYSEISSIKNFQNHMKSIYSYQVLNNCLYLYGPNFEYYFVK